MYILIYVDDIIITGSSNKAIQGLIQSMTAQFSLKDLGSLTYFLDIEVNTIKDAMHLTQIRYLQIILQRSNMQGAKPYSTPLQLGVQLSKLDGTLFSDLILYRTIVRC
jgi:Reverse transcriptase (RNA-dependent DNA polymerase)